MHKIILAIFALLFVQYTAVGQKSIHFKDTVVRLNDSVAELRIYAKPDKGVALFSTRKFSPDDAFVSGFTPDSSMVKYLNIADVMTEEGRTGKRGLYFY